MSNRPFAGFALFLCLPARTAAGFFFFLRLRTRTAAAFVLLLLAATTTLLAATLLFRWLLLCVAWELVWRRKRRGRSSCGRGRRPQVLRLLCPLG